MPAPLPRNPDTYHGMLTGRLRWRTTWRGRLVLQVHECWSGTGSGTRWRDARMNDFRSLGLPPMDPVYDKPAPGRNP